MSRLTTAAALVGLSGVALGAFGAHALEAGFSPEARGWWETATSYVLPHAAAALAAGLSGRGGRVQLGGWLFVGGAIVFAGTLYAMALGAPRFLGAVTPLGGLCLLGGWLAVALGAAERRQEPAADGSSM